jgi:hypothetical protein
MIVEVPIEEGRSTCPQRTLGENELPVELEPGKTYWIGINSERFQNFKDLDGRPALPYQVVFRTKATR